MSAAIERPAYLRSIDEALENGSKIASAIEALAAETPSRNLTIDLQELIRTLRGKPTAEQFVNDESKAVWLPLVLRANSSTTPSGNFKQLFDDLTVANQIRQSKRLQFAYPLIVLAITVGLFVVLANTIVPTFEKMFREFQLKLPRATQLIIEISSTIRTQPVLSCLWLLGLTLVLVGFRKVSSLLVRHLEVTSLVGPHLAGNSESVRAMGRFTSTLAELLDVGAPLNEAILIAGKASQNLRFIKTSAILSKEINFLSAVVEDSTVAQNFPNLVFRALQAGPNKTPSIPLLRQLSAIYFERVRQRVEWSAALFSPLMIIGIGVVTGFTVLALFMPLVSLITSVSGNN